MKISIQTLGNKNRHITSFEKNTISRLNELVNLKGADLIYDETLVDFDEKYYLLLRIKYGNDKTITSTTEGETTFEALKKGVNLLKSKLQEQKSRAAKSVIKLHSMHHIQRAV